MDGLILKGHEAGGRVGAETSFILLQRWRAHVERGGSAGLPVFVQGGVGPNSAAACAAGGATGVVLDAQLLLTGESSVPDEIRQRLTAFDGSETTCPGERLGMPYRVLSRPGLTAPGRAARAEDYPTRLIRVIIPFGAGGPQMSTQEAESAGRVGGMLDGPVSIVIVFSMPVNLNGQRYDADTGVPQSSPTSKVSSIANKNGTVFGIRPSATFLPLTDNVPVPPFPLPPPS